MTAIAKSGDLLTPEEYLEGERERPSVIFEVLSPDTERTDRREKAFAYRHIETVKVYALVEQERMAMTLLRPAKEGWDKETIEGPNTVLKSPEIGLEIPVTQIYERTAAFKLLGTSA
jgi:Uma2 family endonuclease